MTGQAVGIWPCRKMYRNPFQASSRDAEQHELNTNGTHVQKTYGSQLRTPPGQPRKLTVGWD